jgi:hypothetical protein
MIDYSDRTEEIWGDFNELEELAFQSIYDDRINLPSILNQLQQTRGVYAQLKLPSCYEAARSSYHEYMDLTIETWLYVVEGGEAFDSEYMDLLHESTEALNRAIDESSKLGE